MDVKIFDNVTEIVRDDMASTIGKGSKVSIAAACFSMYAYKELRKQLEQVDGMSFYFYFSYIRYRKIRETKERILYSKIKS